MSDVFFKSIVPCLCLTLAACEAPSSSSQTITLTPEWVVSDLDSPESVIPSEDETFLYVSNVNGEGADRDGNGYISKISPSGEVIQKEWATGLNAPKGLALSDDTLYVTDIDHLVLINALAGTITSRVEAPGAGFLNDAVMSPLGVLVSDSANARIYRYVDGAMQVWLEDERLSGVNGLHALADHLLVTTMTEGELLSVDWNAQNLNVIATDMKNADGIAVLQDGSFLVSSWPGVVYHAKEGAAPTVLLDTQAEPILMNDFVLMGDNLIVPNWQPGSLRSYKVQSAD